MVGAVDMGGVEVPGVEDQPTNLATDLLSFVIEGKNLPEIKFKTNVMIFIFIGLTTSFSSVVGYFLVANLTAEQQTSLLENVILELEQLGIKVIHVSADNHAVNTKMLRILNDRYPIEREPNAFISDDSSDEEELHEDLQHLIRHPCDASRIMILSFDPCHTMKNIRNMFISKEWLRNNVRACKKGVRPTEKFFYKCLLEVILFKQIEMN